MKWIECFIKAFWKSFFDCIMIGVAFWVGILLFAILWYVAGSVMSIEIFFLVTLLGGSAIISIIVALIETHKNLEN